MSAPVSPPLSDGCNLQILPFTLQCKGHDHMQQRSQEEVRDILAQAVKQAEQNLLALLAAGKGQQTVLEDPFVALLVLAVHTGFVIEGGSVTVSNSELLQMMEFITADQRYQPDPHFPFSKEQLADAYRKAK